MASEHVLGPKLSTEPLLAAMEANKKTPSTLGVSMRLPFFVTEEMVAVVVDRNSSLVAADARKLVDAFAAVRRTLQAPRLQAVVLLGPEQKMCSRVDTPNRARPLLQAANVAVYRLPLKQDA